MKVFLSGDLKGLEGGLKELENDLSFVRDPSGIPIQVSRIKENRLRVTLGKDGGEIHYHQPIHFFRGVGWVLEAMTDRRTIAVEEEPQFTMNGAMFDCSRNAVFRPETLKTVIRMMALMGLNMLMLYTEDTYTAKGESYFGYMRGRYTPEELKELDHYASLFGIEMIPCIQTLAHLASFLHWDRANELRDTEDVLLANSEATYRFIDRLISSVAGCYRSKRIHIGMDEAFGLGRGRFLDRFGYQRPFDIMARHLNKVVEITDRYGLSPMIWSDMMFRMGSKDHRYYDLDAVIPEEALKMMPDGLQYVYWDYYHTDADFYRKFINQHRALGSIPVFAGGIWTWAGPAIHYEKTFKTTDAALSACKAEGVREVFATLWGDDGAETNMLNGLLGLQLFAEHGYARKPEAGQLRRRFASCTGGNYEAFLRLGKFDTLPEADQSGLIPDNPSKFLLWQDPLLGLFDRHVEGTRAKEFYTRLHREFQEDFRNGDRWRELFEVPLYLSSVLMRKSNLGLRIKKAYDQQDVHLLKRIAGEEIPVLAREVENLRNAHRKQWMETFKPFGWEVLDLRYGGLLSRLDTAGQRLLDFCGGKIKRVEELEEDRLGFDGFQKTDQPGMGKAVLYSRIASASVMGFR
ncbi:glycosyl hydrolase family 20 [Melghirimyces profundicolus]|uniref:Glycosyl hydrolase family 20 n=1 Tax=Melghirimyces profundicolus TaxID=1242148 RepID=A0A2T6C998_9BACL|nr:beta-N-acetylhexosaminidase [Melghirimyces profundicolus]PTX64900.1 glycosyl hydrolase family 20 [Melghirimyces profundicolus]